MYCSACGVAVVQGLSYCNYCGAKLPVKGEAHIKSPEVKPELLVSAMVALFVLGLVAITMLMGVMKAVLKFDFGPIVGFTMLSFLIMLSIEGVLVRLLFRRKRDAEEAFLARTIWSPSTGDAVLMKAQGTNELDAAQRRVLPEPVPSVTEHTTRAFEPVYNERTSK